MPDLNKDHGSQAGAQFFPTMEGENGAEAGTVEAPEGLNMMPTQAAPIGGNTRKIH